MGGITNNNNDDDKKKNYVRTIIHLFENFFVQKRNVKKKVNTMTVFVYRVNSFQKNILDLVSKLF